MNRLNDLLSIGVIIMGGAFVYKGLTNILGRPEKLVREVVEMDYDSPYISGENEMFGDYWRLLVQDREEAKRVLNGNTIEVMYLDEGMVLIRFKNWMNKWFKCGYDIVDTLKRAQQDFSFQLAYSGEIGTQLNYPQTETRF